MQIIRETGSHFDLDEERSEALLNDLLNKPLFAHLATLGNNGPCESPVWFLWEDSCLWIIGHMQTDSFPKRIAQVPACAIGIVEFDITKGIVKHVGLRGYAHIASHDRDKMVRLLSKYFGSDLNLWDQRFVEILDEDKYILICFQPETAVVRDQSYQMAQ